jgi:hypothetical protein
MNRTGGWAKAKKLFAGSLMLGGFFAPINAALRGEPLGMLFASLALGLGLLWVGWLLWNPSESSIPHGTHSEHPRRARARTVIYNIYTRLVETKARTFVIGVIVGYAIAALMGVGVDFLGARTEARRICMQRVAAQFSGVVPPDVLVRMCR